MLNELKGIPHESLSVKNSFDFVEKIRDMHIDDDELMVSFDEEALFPSIPIPDALNPSQLNMFNIPPEDKHVFLKTGKVCM